MLSWLLASVLWSAPSAPAVGTTPFVFDGNRVYAELAFVRPDGSIHRALAFVDMGSAAMMVRESLFKALRLDRGTPLRFEIGALPVTVAATDVVLDPRPPSSVGSDLQVEALLPASVLQRYQVVIDYAKRTLTVARPGALRPRGVAVPFRINAGTGLVAVDASIDGRPYAITIDSGSAYTWVSQRAARDWLASHPTWAHGVGAVGASNMMMSGEGWEDAGILLRIPTVSIGPLVLTDVGALAAGPGRTVSANLDLFDWYSQKNPTRVIGWIGGNVLQQFRLTLDYPSRTAYWLRQRKPDTHDLDQIGLTLKAEDGAFFVAAIATKDGKPTVEGVLVGDKLLQIGTLDARHATWGEIYAAMHGKAGETRSLVLERNDTRVTVTARVTAF